MRRVHLTRAGAVAALGALALSAVLTACGSEEPGTAGDPAASSSTPAGETSDPVATDEPQQLDDGGEIDPKQFAARLQNGLESTKYAHIEFSMSGSGGEMKGHGDTDYTVTPANVSMTMEIGPQTLGMLLVDKVMYVKSSQAGEKYLKYDLGDPDNPLGADLATQLDPAGSVESFVKAVSSVTSVGEEEVDGQTLDRYEMVVDTTKLGGKATSGLPTEMTVGVWLDDLDRMVKAFMDMGAVQYEAVLSDFDKPVDLKAPPADQVVTAPAS